VRIRWVVSLAIFLGSYLPLAVILAVQDADFAMVRNGACWPIRNRGCGVPLHHPVLSFAAILLCLCFFLLGLFALRTADPGVPIEVKETKYIPAELMSYTLPYVVAFMSVGYQETAKLFGLLLFLAWMFWITHKAGQIMLNPLLAVFGWRLYEVKYQFPGDETLRNGRALTKVGVEAGGYYPYDSIQDILILGSKRHSC
jgi:hypothetical protein